MVLAFASRSEIKIICTSSLPRTAPVHIPKVGRLLAADAGLEPIVAKALEINALSKLCVDYLPPELSRQIQAANLKDGQLVLLAATSAAAAKLKLVSGGLLRHLLERRAKVNGVSVRVQPTPSKSGDVALHKPINPLSPASVAALRELHHKLRDSPARAALTALLERHAGGGAKPSPPDARKTGSAGSARRRKEKP